MAEDSHQFETALTGTEALSQVNFLSDCVQLVFQGARLSVYSAWLVNAPAGTPSGKYAGGCDRLVGLIGQRITAAHYSADVSLEIAFEQGDTLSVSLSALDLEGLQFFELQTADGACWAEQVS